MRAVSSLAPVLLLALAFGGPAHAAVATDTATTGRHLDMDSRAPLRCPVGGILVHTAYAPDAREASAKPRSLRSCFSATDRIGAGYTKLLSTSAVRRAHHRMRG
ncbi:hypothetical protein [Kozakia baliensis]|uniref:Uncharacterized protein n=1 Tax=Kozakia baliensis TaxID=153496 RepID=A0A1D8UQA6_9PROT|nr:hypothetical protein [Kozakia baliensis]AOX15806.1 hypothetical protein A0U89_00195 [Kozakia baliensis]AOX20902.1 hypothetical protein A0U90_12120 [Kozakia baliensis]GBR24210.1 hypothetical protein AA0488_0333 [Kozakia baliensis NRIC 0488]GEL64581.1 hypothetical protein KBA01_18670 [Kozakia baliensis]